MQRVWTVRYVASWGGWCTPCAGEDRPLVLTRSGPSGLRAWLSGVSDDERTLLLTCRVCGHGQVVPLREQDDPEVDAVVDPTPAAGVAQVGPELAAPADPVATAPVPAPRSPSGPTSIVLPSGPTVDLAARGAVAR